MVPTFQYPRHRSQLPVLSANSLHWSAANCAKMLSSYDRFIWGKRWKSQGAKSERMMKITGSQVRADDDGWSNTSHRKHFRSLFFSAAVCGRALSSWRTIPEDNIPHRLFWIKESNYSMHSIFGGRLYCFRYVYGFTRSSELTKCDVSRSTGILETLHNSSVQSFISFSLSF